MSIELVREKLKTDNETLKLVVEHLEKHCELEPEFINKILNDKKSLDECWSYIVSEAAKLPRKDNATAVGKEVVYGWAVHYFDEENLEFKSMSAKVKVVKEGLAGEEVSEEELDEMQQEIEETKPRIVRATKQKKAKQIPVEQLSLF